jgi:four helix bundle protein
MGSGDRKGSGEWGVGSGEWGKDYLSINPGKNMKIESYQDLDTWKLGMEIAEDCYRLTRNYPKEELFGMTVQIRKASSSVPANIAEGYGRESTRDYIRFLQIAQGSLKENETHLILSGRVELGQPQQIDPILEKCCRLGKMLHNQIRSLQQKL